MITVKELISILSALDDDRIIILSSDSEGNRYSPLDGNIGIDHNKDEELYVDNSSDAIPAVVLYPE